MVMLDGLPPFWVTGSLLFLIGTGLGSIVTYLFMSRGNSRRHLQLELDRLKENFQEYRDQVTRHFMRTSELVQEMTHSYRSVYEHLASGAQQLCGGGNNPAGEGDQKGKLPEQPPAATMLEDDINYEEDISYDEYAELSRIRNDIDELLGDAAHYPDSASARGTEEPGHRQH